MQHSVSKHIVTTTALAIAAFALSACEFRREGGQEEAPEAEATASAPAPDATPSPTASASETSSIIREDLTPEVEPTQEPAQPVEVAIPMPDGSEIDARAERLLVDILSSDAMDEDWPIILGGHTDSSGNDQANLRSSRARAEAVAAWLVEYGVDDERIEVIAFGEQNPVAPNARPDGSPNEQGRRSNRRVELRIAPPAAGSRNAGE